MNVNKYIDQHPESKLFFFISINILRAILINSLCNILSLWCILLRKKIQLYRFVGHTAVLKEGPLAPFPSCIFHFSPGFSSFLYAVSVLPFIFGFMVYLQMKSLLSFLFPVLMHFLFLSLNHFDAWVVWFSNKLSKTASQRLFIYFTKLTFSALGLVPAFCFVSSSGYFWFALILYLYSALTSYFSALPSVSFFLHFVERSPSTVQFPSPL